MAKFPRYRSNVTLSGSIPEAPSRTGGEQIGAAASEVWQQVGNIATDMFTKQKENQIGFGEIAA